MSSSPAGAAHRRLLLEVCVDSFESAETAIENGADRLEVCGALGLGGGLTPSISLVKLIRRAHPTIPLMVMIRPRPGDFVYSTHELEAMRGDIQLVKLVVDPPVEGFVFGCLTPKGRIDEEATQSLIAAARPSQVTFHRAFDMVNMVGFEDRPPMQRWLLLAERSTDALRRIGGISRVLTSGLRPTFPPAAEWVARLASTLSTHSGFPAILPGSGINARSLPSLLFADGAGSGTSVLRRAIERGDITELHASCSAWTDGPVEPPARREGMGFGLGEGMEREWGRWVVDGAKVRALREIMDMVAVGVSTDEGP